MKFGSTRRAEEEHFSQLPGKENDYLVSSKIPCALKWRGVSYDTFAVAFEITLLLAMFLTHISSDLDFHVSINARLTGSEFALAKRNAFALAPA